jgi:hypothetical protein
LGDGKLRCVDQELLAELGDGSILAPFFSRGSYPLNMPYMAKLIRDGDGWRVEVDLYRFKFPNGQTTSIVGSKATKKLDFGGERERAEFSIVG